MENQICQICRNEVEPNERYPNYVCENCSDKCTSKDGKYLAFSNTDYSGGFKAYFKDSNFDYNEENGHVCYIGDIKCWADEAHFGGIVIETYFSLVTF